MDNRLLGIGAALCAIVACAAILPVERDAPKPHTQSATRTPRTLPAPPPVVPPAAPPGAPDITAVTYQPIAPQTAEEINRNVPLHNAGPAARPFVIAEDAPARQRATHCIAQAVYYEAGSESDAGQRAVAQVVLNRVRSAAFPNSICGVVYQGSERTTGCQFTFACDGSLRREPNPGGWAHAMAIATAALRGRVYAPVGHATHYHADYVVPYWAASMAKIRTIGMHDFYRWAGTWRPATYFSQGYANAEPDVPGMPATESATAAATTTAQKPDQPLLRPGGTTRALAIDQKPLVLITTEKPRLDPALDRIVVLRADLETTALPQPNRAKPPR
ncbi:cell wall hydrolase [Sphingomonas sp. Leaf357]|uniref:cell wall hydrolase n=1 Tax=Sphingomonas sp. Leaf357 TaxID=1736350 RepID=UPI0009E6D32F|nr:cell wall hydrolase [Sphingomonas sp. Leaf357]